MSQPFQPEHQLSPPKQDTILLRHPHTHLALFSADTHINIKEFEPCFQLPDQPYQLRPGGVCQIAAAASKTRTTGSAQHLSLATATGAGRGSMMVGRKTWVTTSQSSVKQVTVAATASTCWSACMLQGTTCMTSATTGRAMASTLYAIYFAESCSLVPVDKRSSWSCSPMTEDMYQQEADPARMKMSGQIISRLVIYCTVIHCCVAHGPACMHATAVLTLLATCVKWLLQARHLCPSWTAWITQRGCTKTYQILHAMHSLIL